MVRLNCRQASVRTPGRLPGGCPREGSASHDRREPASCRIAAHLCASARHLPGSCRSGAASGAGRLRESARGRHHHDDLRHRGRLCDEDVLRPSGRLRDEQSRRRVRARPADRVGARSRARASGRRLGQSGSSPLGAPVELPADPRWPGCDGRDRDLRLLARAGRGARRDGQRQSLGREHDQDTGAARRAVRDDRRRHPLTAVDSSGPAPPGCPARSGRLDGR
jgi:hypothetical protein